MRNRIKEKIRSGLVNELLNQSSDKTIQFRMINTREWSITGLIDVDSLIEAIMNKLGYKDHGEESLRKELFDPGPKNEIILQPIPEQPEIPKSKSPDVILDDENDRTN